MPTADVYTQLSPLFPGSTLSTRPFKRTNAHMESIKGDAIVDPYRCASSQQKTDSDFAVEMTGPTVGAACRQNDCKRMITKYECSLAMSEAKEASACCD